MIMRLLNSALILPCLLVALLACFWSGCGDDENGVIFGPPTPVYTAKAMPAWSPDGQTIAFAYYGNPVLLPRGIYFVNPDGGDLRQMFSFGDFVAIINVCWAPDGEWLAFTTLGWNVYKVKANGDSLTQLTFTGDTPECSWSYSDSLIAYYRISNDSGGIWLMDTYGNNKRYFINNGGHLDFAHGDSIFYEVSLGQGFGQMRMINTTDSTSRLIYEMTAGKPYTTYYDPDVSRDGRMIAFSIDSQIRIISSEGGVIVTLTAKGGAHPSWSPDGQYIVYCEADSLGGSLRIMDSDGGNNRVLLDFDNLPQTGK